MKSNEKIHRILLILILILGTFLRFYNLDNLPMEMYGDIIEGYKFSLEILEGKWPFYFVLGNGPLFFYFVALLAKFLGLSFITMKITSSLVGIAVIFTTYLLGKEILDEEVGLMAAFLVAVSKWPLVFSRLGNMPILVPLLSSLIIYFSFKIIRGQNKLSNWIKLAVLLSSGFYVYPGFFTLPLAVFVLFISWGINFVKKNLAGGLFFILVFLLCFFPFYKLLLKNPGAWFSNTSYFGSKIFVAEGKMASDWPARITTNIKKTILMFFTKGDLGFRINPPGQPTIDQLSSFFLVLGIVSGLIRLKHRKKILLLLLNSFIIMLPSVLVLNAPSDVPNSGRTIGVFPFVFLLVANGLSVIKELSKKYAPRKIILPILSLIFLIILWLNLIHYFRDYPYSLPNHNEGFPRLIAQQIDRLPPETIIYMIGSGWADWGQPDWRAVFYELRQKKIFVYLEKNSFICASISNNQFPKYFILNPVSGNDLVEVIDCFPGGQEKIYYSPKFNFPVFCSYSLSFGNFNSSPQQ